ncbi:unnamed protein product [Diatraea saccharalis]|uniref:PSI domain-containing protein n=1 Tax=Diatraea saccharalis TaxID=40085 RepID=A0A9N9QSK7_9NEOP|nr:unnamed protein product [Diatraea saccharalis]
MAVVTQVPVLGANGTGQRWSNLTDTTPKVSDPISADDDFTGVYETPEMIKAERNLSNLIYDNHSFYNSTFVGNHQFFLEHWANISKHPAQPHDMLSNSYRKATTVKLSFLFPFYGSYIQTITVATGGFIYTGEHTHSWIAATQYIAPLMGNFDTSLNNSSRIMLSDDGSKFTAFWENVALLEVPDKLFTFAATLYKNGDIVFAYKNVPIPVQKIDDKSHPVKIGISDAYLTDKIIFYVRRKTVYEYHRVSFKKYEITNGTVLMMTALPTCVQYTTCDTCLNHNTSFQCTWCENIKKCSSGTDRNKQDWQLRNCDNTLVLNATWCPARNATGPALNVSRITGDAYNKINEWFVEYKQQQTSSASLSFQKLTVIIIYVCPCARVVNTADTESSPHAGGGATSMKREQVGAGAGAGGGGGGGAVGGAVAACACVALVAAVAAWALYAFRNPHTRSGQLFIKYRPSQWNWRRGEARYTAATIHM